MTAPERPGPDYPPEWDDEPDEDDDHDQRHQWWHPTCDQCHDRANRRELEYDDTRLLLLDEAPDR